MASIAVVGPGSVGVYLAAHLAAAGHDVTACARRPFARYIVESPDAPTEGPATVVTDPAEVSDPVDWVLLCVKAHQTEGAAPWLARLCGPGTTVVVVQNGVEGEQRARPIAGPAEVLPAVVYCGAELIEPGHVRHTSHGQLITPDRPAGHRLVEVAEPALPAVRVRATDQYVTEAWRKLGANVAANGITALTRRRLEVFGRADIAAVARRLLGESWAVAHAEGAELGPEDVDAFVAALRANPPPGGTSMLYDRLAGRPTEHDALYGAVLRAAQRHGLDVPLVEAFDALLAAGDEPTT